MCYSAIFYADKGIVLAIMIPHIFQGVVGGHPSGYWILPQLQTQLVFMKQFEGKSPPPVTTSHWEGNHANKSFL